MAADTTDSSEREPERSSDVLILGASMAGIELLYQLRRRQGRAQGYRVTIVDRQETHGYIPLVQERLCERLPLTGSQLNTRALVERDPRARYVVGEIVRFDPDRREVTLQDGRTLRAAIVVIALGSVITPPPTLPGGELLLGYKLEREFEHARALMQRSLRDDDAGETPRFVVVGGGISGVELAGEFADLARLRPPGTRAPRVVLVHSGDRLLPGLCARASRLARKHLTAQGVELRLRTRLVAVREREVVLRDRDDARASASSPSAGPYREHDRDEVMPCAGAFWAGGVRPAPALARLGLPLTPDGWLKVGPTLQCFPESTPTRPRIFACGDAPRVYGGDDQPWPTMQRAIECIWQAALLARNITAIGTRGQPPPLSPHTLREDFFHGVSMGRRSMIVYGRVAVELGAFSVWFRRFLMRQYFRRYRALADSW